MEKELFHEHLTDLHNTYGEDVKFISLTEAAKYCGKDRRTLMADETFPIKPEKGQRYFPVNLINFARWLAG